MRKLLLCAFLLLFGLPAQAQQVNIYCQSSAGPPQIWAPCTSGNPLSISGSFSATVTFPTFNAAFPATGIAMGFSQGGNLVAATGTAGNLNVNCQVGCAGGTFNNNADAVATSATNGQAAAWLYGWNGAAWDRLQVDASKFLKVADASITTTNADLGPPGATACATDTGSCSLNALIQRLNQNLTTLNTSVNASVAAGTNLIGKVGIDQTTPGTTNAVSISQINAATALAGNGATGTGSLRVTIASDNSAVAGMGVGATGSAPPANAVYMGANASGVTGGKLAGLIQCDSHVFKHITSATDTLAVQGVASQTIYICGATGNAAGTATWFLENTASANANCSSSNTQITGVATEAANTRSGFYNPLWGGLKNTSGNGLCINSTGTGGVDVDIWYTQF